MRCQWYLLPLTWNVQEGDVGSDGPFTSCVIHSAAGGSGTEDHRNPNRRSSVTPPSR